MDAYVCSPSVRIQRRRRCILDKESRIGAIGNSPCVSVLHASFGKGVSSLGVDSNVIRAIGEKG